MVSKIHTAIHNVSCLIFMFSCRKHWGFCQGDTLVYIAVTVQSAKCKAQGFEGVWGHAPHPLPSPRKFWEKMHFETG